MSDKFRLDCRIGFQNTFYTKYINVIIDSIGPSIILRSIFLLIKTEIFQKGKSILGFSFFSLTILLHRIARLENKSLRNTDFNA